MSLALWPEELVLNVTARLSQPDLNALLQSCRRFYGLLDPDLYRENIEKSKSYGLLRAAQNGEVQAIKKFLSLGANILTTDEETYRTPLVNASRNGHAEVVSLLFDHAIANKIEAGNITAALRMALEFGHTEVVRVLLDFGVDTEHMLHFLSMPLHLAAAGGHAEIVDLLLSRGAETHKKDWWGSTPLHIAINEGHAMCAQLLALNQNVSLEDKDGQTPLDLVIYSDRANLIDVLLESGANPFDEYTEDYPPLLVAVFLGRYHVVQALLLHSLHPDCLEWHSAGMVPPSLSFDECLHSFIDKNLLYEALEYPLGFSLLDYMPVEERESLYSSPLCVAVTKNNEHIVKLLLDHGADPNLMDQSGRFPVHLAAQYSTCGWGGEDIKGPLEQLIEAGARLNIIDDKCRTALSLAIQYGQTGNVLALLRAGASVRHGNRDLIVDVFDTDTSYYPMRHGIMPPRLIDFVHMRFRRSECKDRWNRGGTWGKYCWYRIDDFATPIDNYIDNTFRELIKTFLEHGSDVHAVGYCGRTVLHHAAFNLAKSTVEAILAAGANPSQADEFGQTPLHLAMGTNASSPAIIQLLIDKGADSNARDNEGYTPLHRAARMKLHPVVRILLKSGRAYPNAQTNNGETPLQLALIGKFPSADDEINMVQLLSSHGANLSHLKELSGRRNMATLQGEEGRRLRLSVGDDHSELLFAYGY